jgi:hypothetical protein
MCGTIDPRSCIWWVLGFGIKTEYDSRLRRSYQASFIAPRCNSQGGEPARLCRHSKKRSEKNFTHHLTHLMTCPIHHGNTSTISEMGPTIVVGFTKAQSSKTRPVYGSKLPRATRARDEVTQMMANILAHLVPHQGDPTPSSFVFESRSRGFLHAPTWAGI